MRRQSAWLYRGATATMGLFFLGCTQSESPAMREARHHREQTLARSVHIVGSLDEYRAENLTRTGRIIAEKYHEDIQATRRDMQAIDRLTREEFEDWTERQPAYRRAIKHQLEGDPANIERTIPYFIY